MDTSQKTSEETLPAGGVVSGTAGDAARDAAAATLRTQLNHRTIRDFDGRPLGEELTATLVNAALHAATSQGMQYATIIRVQDPARRQAIAEVCTQAYVAQAPELWIFVADTRRAWRVCQEQGGEGAGARSYDAFNAAVADCMIAAQNTVVAAESHGLGTTYLGSILNDAERICQVLDLPELTFPVIGLIMGYPNQERIPELKPRMDAGLRVFTDHYQEPESAVESLREYDAAIAPWVDIRYGKPVGPFTEYVPTRLSGSVARRGRLLAAIGAQGFDVALPAEK